MKRQINTPAVKRNTVQALIEYLIDNGMSQHGANQFIHINIPALGGNKTVLDCATNNEWDKAWSVVEAYIAGDYTS